MILGGTPNSHRQELRKQRIVCEADGSVVCCSEKSDSSKMKKQTVQVYLLRSDVSF